MCIVEREALLYRPIAEKPTTDSPPTDQPTTNHLLTDPPTHRPKNHWPNRQGSISKTWSMKNIHFTERKQLGRCKTIRWSIIYLMNKYLYKISIYLHKIFKENNFSVKDIRMIQLCLFFYILNLNFPLLPRYSQFISRYGNLNKTRCFPTY